MADKQLWQVIPVANDVKNDDGIIIGGSTAGTRFAPLTLIANYVHNLWAAFINAITPLKTSFSNGDKFPVVNGSSATAMEADKLLELTAQNALADNLAAAFDPTKPNDDGGYAYYADEIVAYNGATYKFKVNHSSGAWNAAEVFRYDAGSVLKFYVVKDNAEYLYAVTDNEGKFLLGIRRDGSLNWTKGIPDALYSIFGNKVDKELGKSLILEDFANEVSFVTNNQYVFAIVDTNDKILFGIRTNGSVECPAITATIGSAVGNSASKEYVDYSVSVEKNRAVTAEQSLQRAINSIEPVQVVGGENTPDGVYLTSQNGAITFKDFPEALYGLAHVYVRTDSVLDDVFVTENCIYEFNFPIDLDGSTIVVPQGSVLLFKGGSVFNGEIVGNNTQFFGCKKCIGEGIEFSGSWDARYISSDFLSDGSSDNALKVLFPLLSDYCYNELHIKSGNYYFAPQENDDNFLAVPSNTKIVIDGAIKVKPNGFQRYAAIRIADKSNIEITGAGSVEGDADDHDYSESGTHEWGACIRTSYNCSRIWIHDLTLKNATGDGITIAGKDLTIERVKISHCGRQGISVINGIDVTIDNCSIGNIYRTFPKAAVDIEPNTALVPSNQFYARNVRVSNLEISDCEGIQFFHTKNVRIENIIASDCGTLFFGKDSSFVKIDGVLFTEEKNSNGNVCDIQSDCSDIIVSRVKTNSTMPYQFSSNNIKHDETLIVEGNGVITGVPNIGSTKYSEGDYYQYNGNSWVKM